MAGLDSLAGNLADFVTSERSPYEMLLAIPALPQLNSQLKTQLKSTTAKVARAGEKLREKVGGFVCTRDVAVMHAATQHSRRAAPSSA